MNINYMSLFFICLLSLLFFSASSAEVKSGPQASDEILNQSELSQCQEKTKSIAQTAKQLNKRSGQLKVEKNGINQLDSERKQMYSEIDFHSQTSVDKYNRINKQIKQLSQIYFTDTERFNNAVRQYKADIERHKLECDDKQYYKK